MSELGRFQGRVALVTGGSDGIGFAIAERLVNEGAQVHICGRRTDQLETAAVRLGSAADIATVDVADADALTAWITAVGTRHGQIDALVNNAMHVGWSAIGDTALEEFRQDFQVNVDAAFVATRTALPFMSSGSAILSIASINGLLAIDNMAAYSASKAALIHFSKCTAMETAARGIRVNVIAPGVVATQATSDALGAIAGYTEAVAGGVPMGRLGQPQEVAAAAAFLLSDEASYITGVCLSVDGGKAEQLFVPPPPAA